MRSLLAGLIALVVLGAPAARAQHAPVDSCVAFGTMYTSDPLRYTWAGPSVTTTWHLSLSVGACAASPLQPAMLSMSGVLTGWCDVLSGEGVTSHGHRFAFVGIGSRLLFTGEMTGEVPFVPDAVVGDNCTRGAQRFFVGLSGAVLWSCGGTFDQGGVLATVSGVPLRYRVRA